MIWYLFLEHYLKGDDIMPKWKTKEEKEEEKTGVDPQTEELTKQEGEEGVKEPQISVYEAELRKACGQFLAQLDQISCVLAVPRPSVLEDADNFLSLIHKEPEQEKETEDKKE